MKIQDAKIFLGKSTGIATNFKETNDIRILGLKMMSLKEIINRDRFQQQGNFNQGSENRSNESNHRDFSTNFNNQQGRGDQNHQEHRQFENARHTNALGTHRRNVSSENLSNRRKQCHSANEQIGTPFNSDMIVTGTIKGYKTEILLDSGSSVSIIGGKLFEKNKGTIHSGGRGI